MSSTDTNQASELDRIFYNPDHTKTYNPSNKPTGVVMTDFDIYQATEAIQSLIRTEKLQALRYIQRELTNSPKEDWLGTLGEAIDNLKQELE